MAVVVTVAKGYDLGYVWKNQGQAGAEQTTGGYCLNAAQAGEPPGRWWGPGAGVLGFAACQLVERTPWNACAWRAGAGGRWPARCCRDRAA